jgi:hypothetical protein
VANQACKRRILNFALEGEGGNPVVDKKKKHFRTIFTADKKSLFLKNVSEKALLFHSIVSLYLLLFSCAPLSLAPPLTSS